MPASAAARARLALTLVLAVYGAVLIVTPGEWRWLDGVDLPIHETGHLVFAFGGETLGFLGGTLLQLLFPAAFVVYFARRGDGHAASVALWWVAQNCWNVAVYVRDARTEALPLVGGGEHDWAFLLGQWGLLAQDQRIADAVRFAGILLYGWSVAWGLASLRGGAPTTAASAAELAE